MLGTLRRNFFPFIIAFSALSVSASAAFYSVSGLSKLFAGASFEVIIMAASLEIAKLVIASLLYQYWDTINKWLRTYLTIAAIVLVLITSMGIYGFLSAAYQETYAKLVVNQNQIEFLENKADFYQQDIDRYDEELKRISENINILSNSRASSIQVRDTTSSTGFRNTISTTELRLAQSRIEVEEENRKSINSKRTIAADSLQTYKLQILELQNASDTVGELGPLQYLSGLTGTPMDKIINWLLLVIIFVFDPLAISLVVAANFAFDKANPRKPEEDDIETVPSKSVFDEVDEDDLYDNRGSVYYDEEDDDKIDDILDKPAESKVPFDVSVDNSSAKGWYDIADQIAKDTNSSTDNESDEEAWLDDPDVQAFLEAQDEPGPWSEEDDKIYTVGGLTADKDKSFMEFQNKMDDNDKKFKEELDEWKNKKWEVENTAGDVEVIDPEEVSAEDKTETEADRIGTFPNENNPFSVASQVKNIVEKVPTPHLPKETTTTTTLPPEARGVKTPIVETKEEVKKIDEDELYKKALRDKAEKDKQEFLRKNDRKN